MSAGLRQFAGPLAAVALGGVLSVVLLEAGLRATGHEPWRDLPPLAAGEPGLHEPDDQLGWRNKAGVYVWDRRVNHPPIHMTFWSGGRRATGPAPKPQTRRALLIGGSFTQGWAVSDAETLGWRLQTQFSHVEFANYGTAGYGTTQSLMVLNKELAARSPAPELAIYGFLTAHDRRNVAHPAWLRGLATRRSNDRIEPRVPFAELDAGEIRLHPPITYPDWPLKRISAASAFLEWRWFELRSRSRTENESEVTRALLVEMDRASRAAGTHLLVAILMGSPSGSGLVRSMREQGIDAVDCTHPRPGETAVPVYGHPNARVNAYWARCIGRHLRETGLLSRGPDTESVY